jgi:hypothetical protein
MIDRTVPSYYFKQQKYLKRDPLTKPKLHSQKRCSTKASRARASSCPTIFASSPAANPFLIKLKKNAEDDIGLVPQREDQQTVSHRSFRYLTES